ncbi:MAG: insulinase family protein [Anaerolineales bacterium]|nr:insulinase family protein [Anaerolineales bacterium]
MVEHGFEILTERDIPELNTRARLFRHVKTGAQLLSLENDDENKVFGVAFRTPPPDSTGLPHIMEHAVLCGSQKYPVKEPFVELVKGSLKTFLNAFTYPDKTCYPVASQNLQDFYNLIDVYVDAVFHPLIPEHILQQEGWHYELEALDEPLGYKGVVFNEMKGAYSDPDNVLDRYTRQSLFPDTPYGVDSGGDPRLIPDLTYEQFKSFHERYYHPSNARIFFYGDDDPGERLRRMDGYLQGYQAIRVDSAIGLQPPFQQPGRSVVPFDPGEDPAARKGMLVMNWALAETGDPQLNLALVILGHMLIGTPASPLRKALIDSGLGEDLAGTGMEGELRQMYYSSGLKGLAADESGKLLKGDELENLIVCTLEGLATGGIDPNTIAASMNTVEFQLRENNTGAFPRGLLLMLRALTTWLYDGDPLAPLAFEAPLNAIKGRLAAGEAYFESLIRKYFLENPHRTTLVMQPKAGLNQQKEAEEQEKLARIKASKSQAELQRIIENTHHLKRLQETPDSPEALATIPSLKLEDLERENKRIPLDVSDASGCKLLYHDLFTNGILYLDLGFNLHSLPQALLPYAPLFGRALLEMGTEEQDFVRLSQRIGRATGGIYPASFTSQVQGGPQGTAWLYLRGKATVEQAGELLNILQDVLLKARLDNPERFRQMVLEEKASSEAMLAPVGHRLVNTRLRALFNEADWAEEQMNGLSNLFFLRELATAIDQDWQGVLEKLEATRHVLLNRESMLCNITLDAENYARFHPQLSAFLESLPAAPPELAEWAPTPAPYFEGLSIPAQVNYVGKGANLFELGYQPDGSISVILNTLRATWLWERVRVQGGAYGAFCPFDRRSGVLTYLSYRDPNLLATLDNYDGTVQFLRQLELPRDELTKSIIGAIGEMDAYQLPDAKGYTSMTRYLAGDTDESRQRWREQILDTTLQDFHAFAGALKGMKEQGRVVVLGSSEAIQAANEARPGWLQVKKVL